MAQSRRQPLSRERILRIALELVDGAGLEALSMRSVGAALGVEAMSLYNHVPNKAALLDGLHELVLVKMKRPRGVRSWTAYARHQAKELRRVLMEHPHAVPLFASRPAATTASLARLEEHLAMLRGAGFAPLEALEVVQCVTALVVGHTLWTAAPSAAANVTLVAYMALERERFPNVRAVGAALERHDLGREFERGLNALLAGFAR